MRVRQDADPPARVAPVPSATIPREQMNADFKWLFGAGRKVRTP
jgi:hypothetical protein